MDIKSYLDDLDTPLTEQPKRVKVAADGRRLEENITIHQLEDGVVEQVHEIKEEVVPMRVTKRVSRRMVQVPVEERIERVGEDGSVETSVKTLDSSLLSLDRQPTSLEAVANDVRELRNYLGSSNMHVTATAAAAPVAAAAPTKKLAAGSFFKRAAAKHGGRKVGAVEDVPVVDEVVEEEVTVAPAGQAVLGTVAWFVFAVIAGLVTWAVL